MKKWSLYFVMLFIALLLGCKDKEKVRIGFITDIHFDVPGGDQPFGGVELDGDTSDFEIPVRAKEALDSIHPAFIFDTGDLTVDGKDEEFTEYQKWREAQCAPIYPVMGNHDREHLKGQPYGTGFYSICKYAAATRTMKVGNMIFILISEDHLYQDHSLTDAISDQKFEWIESQLNKYSKENNNILLFAHYPLNRSVAWSDYWYGLNKNLWPAWERISNQFLNLIKKYEDHVVAHVSGHIHTHYNWIDHPNDYSEYGYGDNDYGVENIGHFIHGKDASDSGRNLPDIYFLNPQAIDYTHGSPYAGRWWDQNREFVYGPGGEECISTAAVYYGDLIKGKTYFQLITRDIYKNRDVDTFTVKTKFPVQLGDKKLKFMESDLGIREKDTLMRIEENLWFTVKEGATCTAVFQKAYSEPRQIKGVEVISKNGEHGNVLYKVSNDNSNSWGDWVTNLPGKAKYIQVKIDFITDNSKRMEVHDVKLLVD